MKILQVALGKQEDIRDALCTIGEVIYYDWSGRNKWFNSDIKSLFDQHRPGLVWMQIQTPDVISPDVAQYMTSKGAKVINWTGDVREPLPQWFIEVGRHIHVSLFTNMDDVIELRAHGINADYLQIGFPDKTFTMEGRKSELGSDIVFLGNKTYGFSLSDYRDEMVRFLRNSYSSFTVFGSGYGKTVYDQHEEAAIYRAAKIGINLSHFQCQRYSSDRIFRLMGSGCFCLSHYYPGIEEEFVIGEHLDVWNDFNELKSKIDFYLQNEEVRSRIAKAGAGHVHKNHKWINRIEQLKMML